MKSSVIIGSTCHLSICAYSVCWSNVLCFLLCAYNLILACWNIEPKDSTSKSKKNTNSQRGSREHGIGFSCGGYGELDWIHKKEKLSTGIIPEGCKDTLPNLVYICWLDQF